jgi:hypothetical protein
MRVVRTAAQLLSDIYKIREASQGLRHIKAERTERCMAMWKSLSGYHITTTRLPPHIGVAVRYTTLPASMKPKGERCSLP